MLQFIRVIFTGDPRTRKMVENERREREEERKEEGRKEGSLKGEIDRGNL